MNLDSLVRLGHAPWAPTPDSDELDAWHVDDVPLAGTFETPRGVVLFTAVGEVDASPSVWAYRPLSDAEAAYLSGETYESVRAMFAAIEATFAGHEAVVVRAKHFQVENWGRVWVSAGLVPAATEFLQQVIRQLERELPAHVLKAVAATLAAEAEAPDAVKQRPVDEPEALRLRMDAESATVDRVEELVSATR